MSCKLSCLIAKEKAHYVSLNMQFSKKCESFAIPEILLPRNVYCVSPFKIINPRFITFFCASHQALIIWKTHLGNIFIRCISRLTNIQCDLSTHWYLCGNCASNTHVFLYIRIDTNTNIHTDNI